MVEWTVSLYLMIGRHTVLVLVLTATASSLRLFLIGGNTNETAVLVYERLASSVPNRPPQPAKCDSDWSTTRCPRIAVATSAASSAADGEDAYSNDSESMSYKTMFSQFGMAPRHLTLHRDNYPTHGDSETPEGRNNLQIL
jgi:hypothetical protein